MEDIKKYMKEYGKKWRCENKEKDRERKKIWAKNHKESMSDNQKRYYLKNKKKVYARTITNRAIKTDDKCGICKGEENLKKHHWNYDKPLMVSTLCVDCHKAQHIPL